MVSKNIELSKAHITSNKLDTIKLLASLAIIVGAIVAFYIFAQQPLFLRVLAILVSVGIAIALIYTTVLGQSVWQFVRASRGEMRKVVWPTRVETLQATIAVIVMVLIVAIMLWFLDMLLHWLMNVLITPPSDS